MLEGLIKLIKDTSRQCLFARLLVCFVKATSNEPR